MRASRGREGMILMPGGEDLSVVGNAALARKKFGVTQDQPVLRTGVDRTASWPGGQDCRCRLGSLVRL